ncbi:MULTISPECIES: halocin C8-like domain-containing protein [Shouchella]|uniref:halocin C8-like domain-containing protein n=1 Tax=Shouchella TaxID=2893057 RepID=UPI0009343BA8
MNFPEYVPASACETAINVLCGIGGRSACNAACRAIPIIGLLLGFTIYGSLCAAITADGCNAAKRRFC